MTGHLTEKILESIRTKKVESDELIAVDDHLAACDLCREMVASSFITFSAADRLASALAVEHLTYEELVSFVDGSVTADARATIAHHVRGCNGCGIQLRELEEFAGAAPSTPFAVASSGSSWMPPFSSLFLRPIPAIISVIVLLAVGGVIWRLMAVDRNVDHPSTADVATSIPEVVMHEGPLLDPDSAPSNTKAEELTVSIDDGGETVGISSSGELAGYSAVRPAYRTLVKNALASGKLSVADLSDLRGIAGALMGDDSSPSGTFRLASPIGKVVNSETPTFGWQAVPGAGSYVVEIFDQKFNRVASSGELKTPSWKQKLERGRTYSWQVTAVRDGKIYKSPQRPEPDARFRIVDERSSLDIAALKRTNPNSNMLLGVAYANAGLIDDAIREFEILRRRNPRSDLPKRFIAQLRRSR